MSLTRTIARYAGRGLMGSPRHNYRWKFVRWFRAQMREDATRASWFQKLRGAK
jgi:hypothetical protein